MIVLGWIVLAFLTALAALAALGVAVRAATSGRAELVVVTSLAFFSIQGGAALLLGYANVLTAVSLALTAIAISCGSLALTGRGRYREHLLDCRAAAKDLVCLPWAALTEAWRARNVVTVGLLWAAMMIAGAFVLTALIPFASWDGLFYHEPMVGFAIQNHGFRTVDLTRDFCVQAVNGYPRFVECLSLWFVIFTDKTLIELPCLLAAPPLMVSGYLLARRWGDRVSSMGWGVVLFLVPHAWHLMCSTYIDMEVGFFLVAAMYFGSRPHYRIRDAVIATLAMTLIVVSKGSWLVWVPPLAAIAYGRLLIYHFRARRVRAIAVVVVGTLTMTALGSISLLLNWTEFKNPLWPVTYDIPSLGIHWKGLITMDGLAYQPSWTALFDQSYEPPKGGMEDVRHRGFGLAVTYVIVPVSALAFLAAVCNTVATTLLRRKDKSVFNLWAATIPGLVALKTSPSLEQPRYNLHLVVALICLCAWMTRSPRWRRMREAIVGASVVLSLMAFVWLRDATLASTEEIKEHLQHPLEFRTYSPHATLDISGKQREAELHKGDKVAITDELHFVGVAWNFEMSNEVKYIPYSNDDAFLKRVDAYGAKWVIVGDGTPARKALGAAGWELVGKVTSASGEVALRRRGT